MKSLRRHISRMALLVLAGGLVSPAPAQQKGTEKVPAPPKTGALDNTTAPPKPEAASPAGASQAHVFKATDERALKVLREADKAAREWKSYTAKYKSWIGRQEKKNESRGKMKFLSPGMIRMETEVDPITPDQPKMISVMIDDGSRSVTVTTAGDAAPMISRGPSNKTASGEPAATPSEMLRQFDRTYDLRYDPDISGTKLHDQEMDVLFGVYRKGALQEAAAAGAKAGQTQMNPEIMEQLIGSIRLFIGREDRFPHRVEMIPPKQDPPPTEDGKPPARFRIKLPETFTEYYDIDFKAEVKPADFEYTPPEGAIVNEGTSQNPPE